MEVSERGLGGLCQAVLGRRLDKTEQVSDWLRRPLRQSQTIYAALDAFSCWQIFHNLKFRAQDLNLQRTFEKIISTEIKKLNQTRDFKLAKKIGEIRIGSKISSY